MTILKMDAAAIAVLFPEGSEQRLELQTAVIAEFAKKSFSARGGLDKDSIENVVRRGVDEYTSTLKTVISETVRKIQNETLKSGGYVSETQSAGYWDRVKAVKLTPAMEQDIRNITINSFNVAVKAVIEDQLNNSVKTALANNKYWERQIEAKIDEALNSEILKLIQAALKNKAAN
jgi:hypothetical protein